MQDTSEPSNDDEIDFLVDENLKKTAQVLNSRSPALFNSDTNASADS